MSNLHNLARIGAAYLLIKGVAFLAVAALGWTPLPPLLLGGMALTWLAGGILLGVQVRRFGRRLASEESMRNREEETGRFAPVPTPIERTAP